MEMLEDVVTMALIVAIQLGLPVTVLFIIGYLRYRGYPLHPAARHVHLAPAGAGAGGGVHSWDVGARSRPCWKAKGCSPERRAICPAYSHPALPCWQANKQALGGLQSHCLYCERFLAPPPKLT